jgi:hypothetical protein
MVESSHNPDYNSDSDTSFTYSSIASHLRKINDYLMKDAIFNKMPILPYGISGCAS